MGKSHASGFHILMLFLSTKNLQQKAANQYPSGQFKSKFLVVSLVAQMVKNLPAMWETWVRSLGWEDLLEEGMATHSSIMAWRILWTEEPVSKEELAFLSLCS